MLKSIFSAAICIFSLCAPAAAAELTPMETRWLQAAAPVLAYSQQLNLPIDIVVQPQARPNDVPMAMGFEGNRCKLVLSMRGNGDPELEGEFRGAGWNVVKVVWGPGWDALLAKDKEGILRKVMMDTVDGEYQNYKAKDGAYVRKHFFGKHPKLLEMVANMTDDDIWRLTRGGHDPHKDRKSVV